MRAALFCLPRLSFYFIVLNSVFFLPSALDYCAGLGATSFAGEPRRAVRQVDLLWLERSGAPLVYLSLSPQSHCPWTPRRGQAGRRTLTHSHAHTLRGGRCAINSWLRARCSLLPTARVVVVKWRPRRPEERQSAWRKWRKWRLRSDNSVAQQCWT